MASEREQEGEQGRQIGREGDTARKKRAEILECGREIGAGGAPQREGKKANYSYTWAAKLSGEGKDEGRRRE